jgi:integrase
LEENSGKKVDRYRTIKEELQALFGVSNATSNEFVFGGVRDVKRSFDTARRKAGIEDLHFHDLRHLAGC